MVQSPCYKCEERKTACWGSCERYIAFRAEIDRQIAVAKEQQKRLDDLRAVRRAGMRRARKKLWEE